MKKPYASLIISIYNKIDYLKLLFASLERQTFSAFEIIIADDGSNDCVVNELSNLLKKIDLNTKHVWHDDQGWRKPEILNKAILASSSDYLIFIDGDCILHSHFIEEHIYNKKSGVALKGWRYSGLLSIVFCETFLLALLFFQVFNPILSYLCLASILFGFIAAILVYIFLRSHSDTVRIIVIISLACVNIGISWTIEAITRFYNPSRSINEFWNLAMFLTGILLVGTFSGIPGQFIKRKYDLLRRK